MSWFRYLCEGKKRSGTNCDGLILICAVDDRLADAKAQDEYDWHIDDDGHTYCEAPHQGD